MYKMYIFKCVMMVLSVVFVSTGEALENEGGWYWGAGIGQFSAPGYADYYRENVLDPSLIQTEESTRNSGKAIVGYSFSNYPWLSVEAGFLMTGCLHTTIANLFFYCTEVRGASLMVRASHAFGAQGKLVGSAGVGMFFWDASFTQFLDPTNIVVNASGNAPMLGMDLSYKLSKRYSIRIGGEYYSDVGEAIYIGKSNIVFIPIEIVGRF